MNAGGLAPVRVGSVTALTHGVYSLRFLRAFEFAPGECVSVAADALMVPRLYSLASAPDDPEAEVLFDLVEGGELTPRLAALASGAMILAGAPGGSFRDAEGPAVWIGAGTGVAPFLSMVRAGHRRHKRLVHGSRTLAGLLYRAELGAALGASYVPCCPTEAGAGVFAGRLTEWLREAELEPGTRFLLCGSPGMVVDVRDLLIGRGVPFDAILSEIYF